MSQGICTACAFASMASRTMQSCLLGLIAVLAATACSKPQGQPFQAQPAQQTADAPAHKSTAKPAAALQAAPAAAARPQDRIEVHRSGDASVIDVFHVTGIGGAQVKRPQSGWPRAVLVRLHGFPELESFQARGGAGTLDCELNRVEGRPAQYRCRLAGAEVDVLSRTSEYFQVTLPSALLAPDGAPVELHWVDQWR